jgi:mRNA-degrading endonuclease RelE of RelBE toxin-antitoxin system
LSGPSKSCPVIILHWQRPILGIVAILEADPYNRSRSYDIKKLEGIPKGHGQYRIRAGRFRFRYDIEGEIVYVKACSLRREDTYS